MPPKSSSGSAAKKSDGKTRKVTRKPSAHIFSSKTSFALMAAPIIFSIAWYLSTRSAVSLKPSVDRPPLFILPFIGLSLFPVIAMVVYQLFRAGKHSLGGFTRFLFGLLCILVVAYAAVHNLLTTFYGNINNDAISNSWMIDVIAPPEYWEQFMNIPSSFRLATNTSRWPDALIAPHWDVAGVAANHACGPRVFGRLMFHNISSKARIAKFMETKGLMFGGAWMLVEGQEFDAKRSTKPKVYTDYAWGNDLMFNKVLVAPLLIDQLNLYWPFDNSYPNDQISILRSGNPSHYPNPDTFVYTEHTGVTFHGSKFLMDQYSCMTESEWLYKVVDKRWCFYKMMTAKEAYELRGNITLPVLRQPLSFPTGSVEDCKKPYVRAVVTKNLHWQRDTYVC